MRLEALGARAGRLSRARSPVYRVCAEGDSWVNILWPISSALGYEKTFVDAIGETLSIEINNIGWPGDEFKDIVRERQFRQPIQSNSYDFFILSGGGNDFLGGSSFSRYLKEKPNGETEPEVQDCVDVPKLDALLDVVETGYRDIIRCINVWSTKTVSFLHGYDHAIPRPGGRWLGGPLEAAGYDPQSALSREIVRFVVDRFYEVLKTIDRTESRVHLMNLRGQCSGNWHDELHPNETASRKIAALFIAKFQELKPLVA